MTIYLECIPHYFICDKYEGAISFYENGYEKKMYTSNLKQNYCTINN